MYIGEFEEMVLLTVAILQGKAYGIAIITEMENRAQRRAAIGAIQTVLKRLEDKGWVISQFGEATKERGGKRKRYYTITTEGQKILDLNREQRNVLWEAIPKLSFQYGI